MSTHQDGFWGPGGGADPPVGVGGDLSRVVLQALAVLLDGLLVLSFPHQSVSFFFQDLTFLNVGVTGS